MPRVYVIGGPNGAGKTTASMALFPDGLQCPEYVNADAIAAGISPFRPESVAMEAGRVMLRRIRHLAGARQDFAFETTMASRSFAPFLRECKEAGYTVHLLFVWLRSPELAIERVAHRVAAGGHHIPEEVVRRRYVRGIQNFVSLYLPLAEAWGCYDNSENDKVRIASKAENGTITIEDEEKWEKILHCGR